MLHRAPWWPDLREIDATRSFCDSQPFLGTIGAGGQPRTLIRVIIADRYPLIRTGLRGALTEDRNYRIRVLREAETMEEADQLLHDLRPDVCLLGIDFQVKPDDPRIRRMIRAHPSTPFVLLTSVVEDDTHGAALRNGVKGIYSKLTDPSLLPRCVHEVAKGGLWFSRHTTARVLGTLLEHFSAESPLLKELTPRERNVLSGALRGEVNKEIAARLHVSAATVANSLTSIYKKLKVNDRTGLHLFARENNLQAD
jgi:DNA-binding NarL/FixJ family response regulator